LKSFLSLSLMLCSLKTLALDEIPRPEPYTSLTREQKESIAICFQQNLACHESLHAAEASTQNDWTFFLGSFILGSVATIILEAQVHK
jgi:hypothetical protein